MNNPIDIAKHLRRGDRVLIAEATGYTLDYVRRILNSERSEKSKGGIIIINAAKTVIENRVSTKSAIFTKGIKASKSNINS